MGEGHKILYSGVFVVDIVVVTSCSVVVIIYIQMLKHYKR
jgi:hypothetical protein